ncbi:hypothetical protein H1P_510016 [Hyella patelloides LEGE 07179]|uniref:Uncharacterized protein n=1 Tax=Hyella patelloides LEGE 07179 TaxID=945734 RepID=A0A563W067_9CYAN|nr:hypothetical protein [Hyella patelloides]VEP16913.1 hypothetical protein H1P_510016 [Hyella patelloides LEGE 07179]
MNKKIWKNWNSILGEYSYSYLYLVGSISATSLEPILATLLCLILGIVFHLQTYPKAKEFFGRRWELKKYSKYKGLNRLSLEEIKELKEIENSLGENYRDSNNLIYWIATIVSTFLLFYNWTKIS